MHAHRNPKTVVGNIVGGAAGLAVAIPFVPLVLALHSVPVLGTGLGHLILDHAAKPLGEGTYQAVGGVVDQVWKRLVR